MPVAAPPAFAAFPATAAVPTAAARLAYVRRHFELAYPGAAGAAIGYVGRGVLVEVAARGEAFFQQQTPYPAPPHWREWTGQRVPFFFDENLGKPLLILADNRALISADIISAAFYLLSGWQEYFSDERDQYGRFPYAESVQAQYGFVALPVVNYYFDVLRVALEHATGQLLTPRRWGPQQVPFAAFISHDIDNLRSAWKAPAKAALRQRQPLRFARLLWRHLTRPDVWDNLEDVAAQVARYGGRSTFFILPEHRKTADGTPNADYQLTRELLRQINQLEEQGCEIALHGSLGTNTNEKALCDELWRVRPEHGGIRFHYLGWEPRQTPSLLDAASVKWLVFFYDSSLGFAEHYGFRNSYCLPFYPFNFAAGQETRFLEIPLNVMDATLDHPRYLQLAPAEVLPALQPVFAEIEKFGGVASVLWHNQNFDPANTCNGPRQFHEIAAHLQAQGAAFLTGRQVWEEFTTEPADSIHTS